MSDIKIEVGDIWRNKNGGEGVKVRQVSGSLISYFYLHNPFEVHTTWRSAFLIRFEPTAKKALNPSCIDLDDYLKSMPESGRARISKKAEAWRPESLVIDDVVDDKASNAVYLGAIEIGDIFIDTLSQQRVKVTKVDSAGHERPCVWFILLHSGCESLANVAEFRRRFVLHEKADGMTSDNAKPKAPQILQDAIDTMIERGKSYDKDGDAERSMDKVVAMFEILTGIKMTAAQGYKFMVLLKLARSEQGVDKLDNYIDGAAYMALAGEAAKDEKK